MEFGMSRHDMAPKAVMGRPTDYSPAFGEQILQLMASGLSLAAAAAELGIYRQRVYDWEKIYPDFSDAIKLGRGKRQLFLERRLLSAAESPVVTSTIFALKNASEDWREAEKVELSGPNGGPIETKDTSARELLANRIAALAAGSAEGGADRQPDRASG